MKKSFAFLLSILLACTTLTSCGKIVGKEIDKILGKITINGIVRWIINEKRTHNKIIEDFSSSSYLTTTNYNPAREYYNSGTEHYGKGDYDKAIADFNQAIRLNPNDELARQNLEEARRAKMAR